MMSVKACLVSLLACLVMHTLVECQDLPTSILDLQTLFNGDWDNKDQVRKGLTYCELYQIRLVPVDILALRPAATFFAEGAWNGTVIVLVVGVVSQNVDGSIAMTRYNFTDITKYKPGQFDPKDLANITYADLFGDTSCTAGFEFSGRNILTFDWPDCRHTYDEKHPEYSEMITCDHYTFSVSIGMGEANTHFPVYFKRNGPRFPIVRAPASYVSPCDDTSSGSINYQL